MNPNELNNSVFLKTFNDLLNKLLEKPKQWQIFFVSKRNDEKKEYLKSLKYQTRTDGVLTSVYSDSDDITPEFRAFRYKFPSKYSQKGLNVYLQDFQKELSDLKPNQIYPFTTATWRDKAIKKKILVDEAAHLQNIHNLSLKSRSPNAIKTIIQTEAGYPRWMVLKCITENDVCFFVRSIYHDIENTRHRIMWRVESSSIEILANPSYYIIDSLFDFVTYETKQVHFIRNIESFERFYTMNSKYPGDLNKFIEKFPTIEWRKKNVSLYNLRLCSEVMQYVFAKDNLDRLTSYLANTDTLSQELQKLLLERNIVHKSIGNNVVFSPETKSTMGYLLRTLLNHGAMALLEQNTGYTSKLE